MNNCVLTRAGGGGAGQPPVTITIDAAHPGPVIPGDFAGLSFERGPLTPGNAGVSGNLFNPGNDSLVTLFRNMGMHSLRIGGGSVDQLIPAGMGSDGYTGIDNLFALRRHDRGEGRLSRCACSAPRRTRSMTCKRSMPVRPVTSGLTTGTTCPASPSATSRTGMPITPGRGTSLTRRSSRMSRTRRAARTRPTWPAGGASPTRCWRRRQERRCRGRTSARTTRGPTPPTRTPGCRGRSGWPPTRSSPAGWPRSPSTTTSGDPPGQTTAAQAISNMLSAEWVTAAEIGSQPRQHHLHPLSLAAREQPRSGGSGRAALPAHRIE